MPVVPVSSRFIQANTNGELHDANSATLSPLNRGFLYGDAIYEVWRTYHCVLFAWEEHWRRLEKSAESIGMSIPWSADHVLREIMATVKAFSATAEEKEDLYIRLQIYRGEGELGLDTQHADRPGFIILVKRVPTITTTHLSTGLDVAIASGVRRNPIECLNPAWKTGNYLNNIVGLREAKSRGFDDILFMNLAGELTEASTSNLAFIQGNQWITPPTSAGILHGITRAKTLARVAQAAGLIAVERTIRPEALGEYEEAMLLSTTKDVQPVGRIEETSFCTGPNSVTRRLKEAFASMAREYADTHPEFTV